MRREWWTGLGLGMVLLLSSARVEAQYQYPGGYGGYGWGGWGANPNSGYMAGLGAYARGQGVYEVENAQARSINLDTMLKWNKALRAQQAALRAQKIKDDAAKEATRQADLQRQAMTDGSTLNALLTQIQDLDPGALKASGSKTPIPSAAVREIPFEWDTEAISVCLDQMTGLDALPDPLGRPAYSDQRKSLREAIEAALREDAEGDVSSATSRRIADALAAFRDRVLKDSTEFDPDDSPVGQFFNTMGGVTKLLNDPSMRKILGELNGQPQVPLGDLLAFMQSYNLRFGPTTTPAQAQIYRALAPAMTGLLTDLGPAPDAPAAPADPGADLRSAAKDAFGGMKWGQLQAHSAAP